MTMDITIYHNPSCGTSRNTLALLRHAGLEPIVIEYLTRARHCHELQIINGLKPGLVTRALAGEDVGTIIYKD